MSASSIPTLKLRGGEIVPRLGQGTWRMGESARRRAEEVAALKLGLDLGMTLIDTAEMYGDGRENRAAVDLIVTQADLAELDGAFPAPPGARPLEML